MPDKTEDLDVKDQTAESSPAANDDKESPSSGDKPATQEGEKQGETLQDVVKAAYAEATAKAAPAEGEEAEGDASGDVQNLNKTEDEAPKEKVDGKEEAVDGEKKEDEKAEDKSPEAEVKDEDVKGPVPLERFQEVVKKRQEVEQRLEAVQPSVKAHESVVDFCQKQNISPKQFTEALEIQALIINDPVKALERLAPLMDHLQGLTGNKLPEDLQKEVDAGDLPLGRAKEIAQLRAQSKYGEQHNKMTAEKRQAQEMQNFQQTLVRASNMWETAKRKTDPDYKPRAKATDAMGKHELVNACFLQKLYAQDEQGNYVNPTDTPERMTALLEQAYQEVSATFKAQRPKPPVKRPLTRNGSSTQQESVSYEKAGSLGEAVRMAAAQHR